MNLRPALMAAVLSALAGGCGYKGWRGDGRGVPAPFPAVVEAARALDPEALGALLAEGYRDGSGRGRAEVLEAVRRDRDRFVRAEIRTRNVYTQVQEGRTLVRFDFDWRGLPKDGAELAFRGKGEWVFQDEGGTPKLQDAGGNQFLGLGAR